MSTKKTVPLSIRISSELKARLYDLAAKIQKSPHALAQDAVEAAVKAIEENGGRLVVPIEFRLETTHVPAERYPGKSQTSAPYVMNESVPSSSKDTERKITDAVRRDVEKDRAGRETPPKPKK